MIIPLVGVGDASQKRWNMSTTMVNQPFHGYPATPGCSQRESIRMVDFMQFSHIFWRLLSKTGVATLFLAVVWCFRKQPTNIFIHLRRQSCRKLILRRISGRPFAAHTTAPPYHKTVPLCRTHHTVPQTVRTKRTMYGTMVPHDCTYTAKSLQKSCLAPLLGLDVSLRYCIFMIYKSPCLWPVVCKKPLLSQVARNAVHTVVLGFCGVNSRRITTYIFFAWMEFKKEPRL